MYEAEALAIDVKSWPYEMVQQDKAVLKLTARDVLRCRLSLDLNSKCLKCSLQRLLILSMSSVKGCIKAKRQ